MEVVDDEPFKMQCVDTLHVVKFVKWSSACPGPKVPNTDSAHKNYLLILHGDLQLSRRVIMRSTTYYSFRQAYPWGQIKCESIKNFDVHFHQSVHGNSNVACKMVFCCCCCCQCDLLAFEEFGVQGMKSTELYLQKVHGMCFLGGWTILGYCLHYQHMSPM